MRKRKTSRSTYYYFNIKRIKKKIDSITCDDKETHTHTEIKYMYMYVEARNR